MIRQFLQFAPAAFSVIIGVAFYGLSATAMADQNDPRLDELFADLHTVISQEAADQITTEIWTIWRRSPDNTINELMRSGGAAMSQGRLRRALVLFDEIVERDPGFAEGWNKRATIYFFMREYEKSLDDVRQTLLLEPRHFGAMAGLGLIFMSLNYYEPALEAFEKALDINPHLPGPKLQIQRLKQFLQDDPA